jgi:hypothetical protein
MVSPSIPIEVNPAARKTSALAAVEPHHAIKGTVQL